MNRPDFGKLKGLLRGEQERALGRQAIRAGLLSEGDLDALLARGAPVEDALRVRGASEEQVRLLRAEIDREDYALFRPDRNLPTEVAAVQGQTDRRLGDYVLVTRLGRGGVGEVWKAWDVRLGRWVAVKVPMAGPDPEHVARRFTREALAAARLNHPNIVAIHHVAETYERPFIVMQYVEGETLARRRPPLRQALEILRDVARAVGHAHAQGVVHRDLKPANIMIAADGRPFVLDFGLAHLGDLARLQSREGLVSGTAAYMSPEQARGEPAAREPATDVYALGATLYEAATGRPPFDGDTFAETLEKVLHADPAPPRSIRPEIPRDVETVILKAMEKDPGRRYPSAGEFADDLERCLLARSIAARRSSAVLRRFRRHSRIFVAAAVGVAATAIVLAALEAQRRDRLARDRDSTLRAVRELSRVSLEAALKLRRAGANESMQELVPRMEGSYREAVASLPDVAEIHYLMGRVQRALLEDGRALALQARALAADPEYPPALYERIILASKAFGRTLRAARTRAPLLPPGPVTAETARRAAPPAPERLPELARARAEIVRDCETLERLLQRGWTGEGALRLGEANALAARGLFAFHRGDRAAARDLLEKALEADAQLEEAWETLARTWLADAADEEACRRAEEAFGRGLDRDLGYAPHWVGRADVRAARAAFRCETGGDPAEDLQSAEDDYAQALRLKDSADTRVRRAALRIRRALHRAGFGENPLHDFARAEEDLEAARRLDPGDPEALVQRGLLHAGRAEFRIGQRASPADDCAAFEREAAPALERDPSLAGAWAARGLLWALRASHRATLGQEAMADLDRAVSFFDPALRYEPGTAELWERRAFVRLLRARHRTAAGEIEGIEADLARAVELDPSSSPARLTRAALLRLRAASLEDPSGALAAARQELSRLLARNPRSTAAWMERGHVELDGGRARSRVGDGGGARECYVGAIRHYEEAIRLNPNLEEVLRGPLREARRGTLGPD
jgi:serine/threonine-protein kinase